MGTSDERMPRGGVVKEQELGRAEGGPDPDGELEMADDVTVKRSSVDSKDDALVIGKTVAGGDVVMVSGPWPRLMVLDPYRRCIAVISGSDLAALFESFDGIDLDG